MKKGKRILALAGAAFLAGLYLMTLVLAVFATPAARDFFRISLLATIIIPLIIYIYMLVYRLLSKNKGDGKKESKNS